MSKFLFILTIFIFCSCQTDRSKWSRDDFQKYLDKSPIHNSDHWKEWVGLPLKDRVVAATPQMIDYLIVDNEANKYPTIPKRIKILPEYKKIINEAIDGLPVWIKEPIKKRVAAIMIVDELGASAFTDQIDGFADGKAFIVFDKKVLTKKANDWCTWKEESAFKKGPYKIKCTIEKDKFNDAVGAFRYIFLHEVAHVLKLGSKLVPFWNYDPKSGPSDTDKYRFLRESWKYVEGGYIYKNKKYKNLARVHYYSEKFAKNNDLMLESYRELKKSDFVTLYGASNVWDDMAEAYANYIHTQVLKKPFKIEIFKNDSLVLTYRDCWREKRCQNKKRLVLDFIKGN